MKIYLRPEHLQAALASHSFFRILFGGGGMASCSLGSFRAFGMELL